MEEKYPYPRKLRIPGTKYEAEVRPDEECEKASCVICVRVGEIVPPAHIPQVPDAKCVRCGQRVLRDSRGPKTPPSVCMQCAPKFAEELQQHEVSE